jgi:hypothetical protein
MLRLFHCSAPVVPCLLDAVWDETGDVGDDCVFPCPWRELASENTTLFCLKWNLRVAFGS